MSLALSLLVSLLQLYCTVVSRFDTNSQTFTTNEVAAHIYKINKQNHKHDDNDDDDEFMSAWLCIFAIIQLLAAWLLFTFL